MNAGANARGVGVAGAKITQEVRGKGVPPTPPSSTNCPEERKKAGVFNSLESNNGGDSRGKMTSAQMQAQTYLNDRKIFELFNFLIGHLLVDEPTDPIEYLVDLLDKCMLFRAGLAEPPLLFTSRHIESMFQSLDPGGLGNVSVDQYKAGMNTLGIGCYNVSPKESSSGRVDKQTFEEEAKKCLVSMLVDMVGKTT